MIGRLKYIGGITEYEDSLTKNEEYSVIAIEQGMLRIIDDEGSTEYLKEQIELASGNDFVEGYLFTSYDFENNKPIWEIIHDPQGLLKEVIK